MFSPAGRPVAVQAPIPSRAPVPAFAVLLIAALSVVKIVTASGLVVIVGFEFTVMLSTLVAHSPALSVTFTVKVKTPV